MEQETGLSPDFQALFQAAPGLFLVLLPDLTVVAVSDAFARAMNTPREGILGHNICDVFPNHTEETDATGTSELRASLQRVLALGRPDAMAVRKHRVPRSALDGGGLEERCWGALNTPVIGADGTVRWIIHRVEDVTELVGLRAAHASREMLVQEQQHLIERLRAVNQDLAGRLEARGGSNAERDAQTVFAQKIEAITRLTDTIAHDLNNLLGVILGNVETLLDQGEIAPQDRQLAVEALDAAAKGGALARRLLAFSRRQSQRSSRVDANEIVGKTVRTLGRTLGPGIEISVDLANDLWPVVADEAQLETGLANLAASARDAMPDGGRLIIATRNCQLDADYASEHLEARPGDYAMIEISHTGRAMPQATASRGLEPVFTNPGGAKENANLGIVSDFIKQWGGHLEVCSDEIVGTTFRLYLPRLSMDAAHRDRATASGTPVGGTETVLVVEDNPSMRRVVKRQLDELGYRVFEADRATTALRVLENERIDLLFTDIVTPGSIDGMALARTAAARWPALKILLTSGFPQATNGGRRNLASGLRLLSKPYRREELAQALREVLAGDNATATAEANESASRRFGNGD